MNQNVRPRRVIVFVSSLGSGGAERVAVRVCGWLSDAGHDVCLLTLSSTDSDFYQCPPYVRRVGLSLQRPSRSPATAVLANLSRLVALRKAVRSHGADSVVSLGNRCNVLMLLATMGLGCRKIISERDDPVRNPLSRGWSVIRRLVYPMAALHVSQSSYVSGWLKQKFPRLSCVVIGNTAGSTSLDSRGAANIGLGKCLKIIAVGRLTRQKGFDLLLQAFARAKDEAGASIRLSIVGDGEDFTSLRSLSSKLGLDGMVEFHGQQQDVGAYLSASDIFVLSSRWEGFPNVLIEAMSSGLPAIVSNCSGGVRDIIDGMPGDCAFLFEPGDVDGLKELIIRLTRDRDLLRRASSASIVRAQDYSEAYISSAWISAILGWQRNAS